MHPHQAAFLFGDGVPHAADPDERAQLLARDLDQDAPAALQLAIRSAIANQIADDDPPQVWSTAQRLLAAGLDRTAVMRQLSLALTPTMLTTLQDKAPFDESAYLTALERLPLPSGDELRDAMTELSRTRRSLTFEELDQLVADRFGLDLDDPVAELLLDRVSDGVIGRDGPLEILADDHVVHVEALLDGIVLTHLLTQDELDRGELDVDVDLAGFRRRTPTPDLTAFAAGDFVAVQRTGDVVRLTALEAGPAVTSHLVQLLRTGYDQAVAEPWLPVPVEELVLSAVLADPDAFREPRAPLSQLLAAAQLEVRGDEVAHEQSVWANDENARRTYRLLDRIGTGELGQHVVHVLTLLAEEPLTSNSAREALDALADPATLEVVAGELFEDDDPAELVQRLAAAASQPTQRAVAHWLLAVVAERQQRVEDAEAELREAVRVDADWEPAVDRLAWYRADRGDAAGARELWARLGMDASISPDVRELAEAEAPALGRNDRCWCGSGRKFKQCHLGRAALPPLPERVGWLYRKANAYLERRGGEPETVVYEHAEALAADPEDPASVEEAFENPLLTDVVLHEGGWFEAFLDERGALLPEDELLLARAWTLVDRTVYEVTAVRPGAGLDVRDLRTGEALEIRERTFSRQAQVGGRFCARAVPDGQEHQLIGGIFLVPPGRERALLDLLDERDGLALLAWVAALHRPPVVVGPDGRVLELGEPGEPAAAPGPEVHEAMLAFLAEQEQRWCEQPVPALDGLTPARAAADPTRRDDLIRLIDSFPAADLASGAFTFRPERLRELLDLPARG